VLVTGTAFGPTESVKLFWDSTATTPLTIPLTLATGSFSATVTVPQATRGAHTLIAVGQTTHKTASTPLQVKPLVFLSPASGKATSVAHLFGAGFGASETVAGLWSPGFKVLGTASSNASGTVALTFTVPLSPTGSYAVVSYGLATKAVAAAPFTVTP
jgi:hypothetical protein